MHYISLGYFCSVAMELEKMGLRTESSPFDWLISDFDGVIRAIQNEFCDFLEYTYMEQSKDIHKHYRNKKYGFKFFHDFNEYIPLEKQLPVVREKYDRRIKRFYKTISEPTVFVRYISDASKIGGISKELLWIEEHLDEIVTTLKAFNSENEIIYIANNGVTSEKIRIYNVEIDEGDNVARSPFSKNADLWNIFSNAEVVGKQDNIQRYLLKEKNKNKLCNKIKKKLISMKKKLLLTEYVHEKQY